jgi:integrase
VRRSLKITENGLDFGPPKNKTSRRSVALNQTAVAALRAHRARQNAEILAAPEWRDTCLIFPSRVGGPINPSNLYHRDYKPLLKHAGLENEGFTFHSLRHTFASALCNKREYPKVIQSLLGHSSITQTMDTYSHLMEGMSGDALRGLDEAFG